MCLKCWGKNTNPPTSINLIDDDFGIAFELSLFAIHVKKEVCDVLESFLFILWKYEEKNPITRYV